MRTIRADDATSALASPRRDATGPAAPPCIAKTRGRADGDIRARFSLESRSLRPPIQGELKLNDVG
jgi:hypothetical protein